VRALLGALVALAALVGPVAVQPAFAQAGGPGVSAHRGWRCGTPARLPELAGKPRAVAKSFAAADEENELVERDAFGTMESRTSDHFSIKWGQPGAVDEASLQPVLDALELSWKQYVGVLEHRVPLGSETYFVNAYVGSTGGASPEIDFDGGYASLDDDGYPYLVISPTLLGDVAAAEVAAHEFYHVVEMSTDAFQYDYDAMWYWEASAVWASQEVYPDSDAVYYPLGSYGLVPHVSVDLFADPFSESILAMHQYGAFIFPRFISENVADARLIRDSWEIGAPADLPLDVLGDLLADLDVDIDDVFAEYAAHNAGWDYAKRSVYNWIVAAYEDYYPEEAHRYAAIVAPEGTDGWVEAPSETQPWGYGYNVIRLANPVSGDFSFAVEGDAQGSAGSAGVYRATVVRSSALGFEYQPIPIDGLAGQTVVEDVSGEMALYLVVSAQPTNRVEQETFGFRYRIELDDQTHFPAGWGPVPRSPGYLSEPPHLGDGGGCAASRPSPSLLLVLLLAAPLVRRRRAAAR